MGQYHSDHVRAFLVNMVDEMLAKADSKGICRADVLTEIRKEPDRSIDSWNKLRDKFDQILQRLMARCN